MLATRVPLLAQQEECCPETEALRTRGLLTYGVCADAFVRSFHVMCSGEWRFPRNLPLMEEPPAQPSDNELRRGGVHLSPREREMLLQVIDGHTNKVIARHVGITETRVKVHLKDLLRKIGAENRTQAAIWALAHLPEIAARNSA